MGRDERSDDGEILVTHHGSEMPHDPEIMRQAREAFMQWAAKTRQARGILQVSIPADLG